VRRGSRRSVERLRLPDLGRSLVWTTAGGCLPPCAPRGAVARAHQFDRSLRAVNTSARAAARRSAHSPTRFAGTPASPRANTPKPHTTHEGGSAPSRHPQQTVWLNRGAARVSPTGNPTSCGVSSEGHRVSIVGFPDCGSPCCRPPSRGFRLFGRSENPRVGSSILPLAITR